MQPRDSVVLKLVLEIDGIETVIKQFDYTDSINDQIESELITTTNEIHEIIGEDIAIGEAI